MDFTNLMLYLHFLQKNQKKLQRTFAIAVSLNKVYLDYMSQYFSTFAPHKFCCEDEEFE
jgi:hypothetical protein